MVLIRSLKFNCFKTIYIKNIDSFLSSLVNFFMLSIGTAQFGFNYGICNKKGIVKKTEVLKILKFCKSNKILSLDTAQGYGKSHKVLGKINLNKFKITSKLSFINKRNFKNLDTHVIGKVDNILKDLGVKKIHSLLLHDTSQLKGKFGRQIYEILKRLKNKKFLKLGVSVYSKRELEEITSMYEIDIVNLPISVANQSFVDSKYLSKLKKMKIEIHARSIFLQGLLLSMHSGLPRQFKKNKFFQEWDNWLKSHDYNRLEASLGYLKSINYIDKIIVGVDNLNQLKDIVEAYKKRKRFKFMKFTQLPILRNPSKW